MTQLTLDLKNAYKPKLQKKFIKRYKKAGKAKTTVRNLKNALKDANRFGLNIHKCDEDDVLDFIDHLRKKGLQGSTIEKKICYLNKYEKYLFAKNKKQTRDVLLARNISQFKGQERRRRHLSHQEIQKLYDHAEKLEEKIAIAFLYYTSARNLEARSCLKEDIFPEKQEATIPNTKRGRNQVQTRLVFYKEDLVPLLNEWLEESPGKYLFSSKLSKSGYWKDETLAKRIHKPAIRAELMKEGDRGKIHKSVCPQALRHSFTETLRAQGLDFEKRSWLRGDNRQDTSSIYEHPPREEIKRDYLKKMPKIKT